MDLYQAIITGVIQGVTEFIPVSSSAHLAVLPLIVQWPDPGHAADVFMHLGSLGAVFIVFWKEIKQAFVGALHIVILKRTDQMHYAFSLLIANLPTIIVFGLVEIFMPFRLNSLIILALSAMLFGGLLYIADQFPVSKPAASDKLISYIDAFIIGLFQVFSIIPGASRLGTCITGMRFLGYDRMSSFRFSMMMSVIPVVGAVFLKSLKILFTVIVMPLDGVVFSCFTALIFGILTLKLMVKWLDKRSFLSFVVYRVALGIVLLYLHFIG